MKLVKYIILLNMLCVLVGCSVAKKSNRLTDYVNPFIGTATLWDSTELGYKPTRRAWGAEVYPGASLPNSMVQVTPVTMWRSGSGYQYEDTVIYAFVHTSKGHWNLCYVPFIGVSGEVEPKTYYSSYSHEHESASPGYYQVYLEKYDINAEVTSTLRCAYHKYTYKDGKNKKLLADLARSNEHVKDWKLEKRDNNVFIGYQKAGSTFYFYAVTNHKIRNIESLKDDETEVSVVNFLDNDDIAEPLELKVGFSYVSVENAKENLESEMLAKSFSQVRTEAEESWEKLLSKIRVIGGTEEEKETFYSTFYRSFLWPILLSDANGEFVDANGNTVNKGFRYYSNPSFWDDYRNKLILLGMISPDVATDVIKSITDRGKIGGFMPTFFHGDHASTFVTGSYLRGIRDFDVQAAYEAMYKSATTPGKDNLMRPDIDDYIAKGYVPLTEQYDNSVSHALEYYIADYALSRFAQALGKKEDAKLFYDRSLGYKHYYSKEFGTLRPILPDGTFYSPFDPMEGANFAPSPGFHEGNSWNYTFYVPHDVYGLAKLMGGKKPFIDKLQMVFDEGLYDPANEPDIAYPYLFSYFKGEEWRTQKETQRLLDKYFTTKPDGIPGNDDTGTMASWAIFNMIGFYPDCPGLPEYTLTTPVFDKVTIRLDPKLYKDKELVIESKRAQPVTLYINKVLLNGKKFNKYRITHDELVHGQHIYFDLK